MIDDDLALALELADRADELTMAVFTGEVLAFEDKHDGTPVTETDRAVEQVLRDILRRRRPDDSFIGEETGEVVAGDRCWIVDPIDGTYAFVAGNPIWATQIALVENDEVVVGVTSAPALGSRLHGAAGLGCVEVAADGERRSLHVSPPTKPVRWTTHPPIELLPPDWRALADKLGPIGTYVEPSLPGALMVVTGAADVCLQLDCAAWDHGAFAGLVRAAGGRFSHLDGATRPTGVRPALFSNGVVHDTALQLLACDRWDGPGLDAWHPWTPAEAAARLRDIGVTWYVAGGWAIDLHLGEQTREHDDLEIAVLRDDFDAVRAALDGLDLFAIGSGELRALGPRERHSPSQHQTWVLDPVADEWRIDVMIEPGDAATWVYRRDESLRAARADMVGHTADGIPYLLPHGALFFKARAPRPKDEADFDACLPRLTDGARAWLTAALERFHPGHPWLAPLTGGA